MKKDLFRPTNIEKDFQLDILSVLSSTPTQKGVEDLMPKIRRLENKMRKRREAKELGRSL